MLCLMVFVLHLYLPSNGTAMKGVSMNMNKFSKHAGLLAILMIGLINNAHAESMTADNPNQAVSLGSPHVVPEADKWAMVALGVGLVGLRLRRKQDRYHRPHVK